MTSIIPQCAICTHLRRPRANDGRAMCAAFQRMPIPLDIFWNEFDHRKPYPGDHGIRFEPLPKSQSSD